MMWTCTKCSYAYNKVEAAKCEVCSLARQVTKEEPSLLVENGAQMVNTELIKVRKRKKFTSNFLQRKLGLIDIWNTTLHAWPVFSNHKHFFHSSFSHSWS